MKSTSNNSFNSTEDLLSDHVARIIDIQRMNLFRSVNAAIVTLFWETGIKLHEYAAKNKKRSFHKFVIPKIAEQLYAKYGSWFDEKNLTAMMDFARQFPDMPGVAKIASFLSWEYIVPLLQIEDLNAQLFYSRLVIEQGLSVNNLRKQMADKLFEKEQAAKKKTSIHKERTDTAKAGAKECSQLMKLSVERAFNGDSIIKSVFKQPLLSSYRRLTKASEEASMMMTAGKETASDPATLFSILSAQIENYRYHQNSSINATLNFCFREIGDRINQQMLSKKDDSKYYKSVIRNASAQLKEKYDKDINEKQLREMAELAEQFSPRELFSQVGYTITWQHILVLLPLQNIEAKLFYAELAATKELSVKALQKQMDRKMYEQKNGAIKLTTAVDARARTLKTVITKKNQNLFTLTTITNNNAIKHNKDFINIFKNSYLPLLVL